MAERFADVVSSCRAVLDGATEWQGDTTSFGGLETTAMPEGADAPELLLAGHGPRSLALAACERHGRDPDGLRRSLLLGFGRVLPTSSVESYLSAAERAAGLGFDELVVFGSDWAGGTPPDVEIHVQALARLR